MLAKARINPMLSVHFIGSMKRSHSDAKLQSKQSSKTSGKGDGTAPSLDAASLGRSTMGNADGDDTTSTTSATETVAKRSHRTLGNASALDPAEGVDKAQATLAAAKIDQSTPVVPVAERMRSRKNKSSGKRPAVSKGSARDTDRKINSSRRGGNSGKRQRSDGTVRAAAAAVALPKHSSSEADENEEQEYSLTTAHGQLRHNSALTYTEAVVAAKAEYNRRNAARARQRAKTRLVELQQEVHHLSQHVQTLKTTNETLQATLRALKEQSAQLVHNQKAIDNGATSIPVAAAGAAGFGTSALAAAAPAAHAEPQLPQQAPQPPSVHPIVPIGNPADLLLQFFLASALQTVPQPPPPIVPTQPSQATATVPIIPSWLLNAPAAPTPAAATFLPPPQMDPTSLNVQWLASHPAAIGTERATTTTTNVLVLPLNQGTDVSNNNSNNSANDDRDDKLIDEAPHS